VALTRLATATAVAVAAIAGVVTSTSPAAAASSQTVQYTCRGAYTGTINAVVMRSGPSTVPRLTLVTDFGVGTVAPDTIPWQVRTSAGNFGGTLNPDLLNEPMLLGPAGGPTPVTTATIWVGGGLPSVTNWSLRFSVTGDVFCIAVSTTGGPLTWP